MALRDGYSLINSEFNDFLFASIGEERNGMVLSVISALTRLDIDPWSEAARLAKLSREMAAQTLAPMIGRLPVGLWALTDVPEIAARLVEFLPRQERTGGTPSTARGAAVKPNRGANYLIYMAVIAMLLFSMAAHYHATSAYDAASIETTGTDSGR
jgi:hypothetical protein